MSRNAITIKVNEASLRAIIRELVSRSEQAHAEVQQAIEIECLNLQRAAKQTISSYGRVDLGDLRARIFMTIEEMAGYVWTDVAHGPFIEFGTKGKVQIPPEWTGVAAEFKGKGMGKMPPLEIIKAWCKRKGIPEEATYPIARSIGEHGISATPFMFPNWEVARKRFFERVQNIIKAFS